MNDIEVLEDYINRYDIQDLDNEGIEFKNALENLLKERQSDKEKIKKLEEELEEKDMQHELELIGKEEYTKASMGEIIEQYYTANEDCIPTSLIKEKIEPVINNLERDGFVGYADELRDISEELLKGE